VLEHFRFARHEESGVSTDLPEMGVPEAVFDDAINKTQGNRMIFHFAVVKIVEPKR